MLNHRIKAALVVLAASAGLSACTSFGNPYGGSGVGVSIGSGSPYGYGSQYGYGSPYGYGYGYGGPYGYTSPYFGYARYPYFGWYDGFYYPGAGGWVYDPYGGRFPITERQGDYWRNMLKKFREERGATAEVKPNFAGFRAKARAGASIPGVDLDAVARADQASVRQINQARRRAQVEQRQQVRAERAQARAERSEVRVERQETMRSQASERREARRTRRGGGE